MGNFSQKNRRIKVSSPLPFDDLLLQSFSGQEAISSLYQYQLEMVAENTTNIGFDKLIGQGIGIEVVLDQSGLRNIHGICSRVTQGGKGKIFTQYWIEIVPRLWLLTKRFRSQIFQQKKVPDILKELLTGIDTQFDLEGNWEPRDYCVQYRETDFNFVSRLMEEEGICYFFKHTADGHKMVLANSPLKHPNLPIRSTLTFEGVGGGERTEERILGWDKTQELRSGKYTLWDHTFELPHKHLETTKPVLESVSAGKNTYKLKVGGNESLEVVDWPGGYAKRFAGINKSGGEQAGDLQKIFQDNARTSEIRMQAETAGALVYRASSDYLNICPGHKFTLERHFSDDGTYLVTSAFVLCDQGQDFQIMESGGDKDFRAESQFTCIPVSVPFRPSQVTPKPQITGTQTAVVCGPSGEEIFTDKYGRVKVQFHWDPHGKNDGDSSCWVRVATSWAGKTWGMISIPRVGQEVVVAFIEGDPDQPIIIGSVYNADQMPPWGLPANKTQSGIKSRSLGGGTENMNVIRFEDKEGAEQIFIHANKIMDVRVKEDAFETVMRDAHYTVKRDATDHYENDWYQKVKNNWVQEIGTDHNVEVKGKQAIKVANDVSQKVGGSIMIDAGTNFEVKAGSDINLKAGPNVKIEASSSIVLKAGSGEVVLDASGVTIKGSMVTIDASMVKIASGPGSPAIAPFMKMLTAPIATKQAVEAMKGDTNEKNHYTGEGAVYNPSALPAYTAPAAQRGALAGSGAAGGAAAAGAAASTPPAEQEPPHYIEIKMVDEEGEPVPGEEYEVTTPEGTVKRGSLDSNGYARVDGIKPGNCKVKFPRLDKTVVEDS